MSRRKKPLPTETYTASVIDLAQDGRGVARQDGKVVFLSGALPGETVRYQLTRRSRDVDEGRVTGIEQASVDRVTPPCAHFGSCGGCSLQHLAPAAQIVFKQKQLLDALARIGGVQPDEVAAPITGPTLAYRRRARLGVKHVPKKGGLMVGFREQDSPLIAALDRCEVLDPRVGGLIRALATLLGSLSIAEKIPQIEVATAGHVALVLRVMDPPNDSDRAKLLAFAREHDLDFWLQTGGPDSVAPLAESRTLAYSPDGSSLSLEFAPNDFVQVNAALSQAMVRQALHWLAAKPDDAVLELFAGLGNFTAPLVAAGAKVTALEGEAALVEHGRANLARNGLEARFLKADLFKPQPQAEWLRDRYDLALIDPPRSGASEILPHLAACGPRRIVYVSCHPGTLARDAGELARKHGYRLRRVGVLDMFPHTAHVESMALFVRP